MTLTKKQIDAYDEQLFKKYPKKEKVEKVLARGFAVISRKQVMSFWDGQDKGASAMARRNARSWIEGIIVRVKVVEK